ncbi:MAG: DUF3489 domain-containing protein [bacterium]|nr:DUF3489 domain-containing protein [bacterium]
MPKIKSPSPNTVLSAKAKSNSDKAKSKAYSPVKRGTKISSVIKLLSRAQGATLDDIVKATGWQPHTVRSILSRTLPKGHGCKITSSRPKDGQKRLYRIENNKMQRSG